jgi:hypothetical protein
MVNRTSWCVITVAVVAAVIGAVSLSAQVGPGGLTNAQYRAGQSVAPVFEGWLKNADGSYELVFGYLNRNYEEEPEIPVGPDNVFSPGSQDRGQPTHFYPRRQQFMFKVHVPADFKGELTWALTRAGRTDKAVGHLALEWELSEVVYSQNRRGLASNAVVAVENKPPTISVAPNKLTATVGAPVTLNASATDDGVPKPPAPPSTEGRGRGRGPAEPPSLVTTRGGPVQQQIVQPSRQGLAVTWTHWRGPAKITFEPRSMPVKDGKAMTSATFREPGTYVVRAYADDGVWLEAADVTVVVSK